MSQTVDDLRNEIRLAVGRHERIESTAFTKEALAAVRDALDCEPGTTGRPSKSAMRGAIRRTVDELDDADPDEAGRPFRKAELGAIAAALRSD